MNTSCHAALVDAANFITLYSDLLHMVEKLNSANGTSWQSSKTSWKKIGQDIGFNSLKLVNVFVWCNIPEQNATMQQS